MRTTLGILAFVVLVLTGLAFAAVALAVTAAIIGLGQYVLDGLDAADRRPTVQVARDREPQRRL